MDFVSSQVRPIPVRSVSTWSVVASVPALEPASSSYRITRIGGENRALLAIVIDPFHHHNDSAEHYHNRNNSRHSSLPLWKKYWDTVCESRSSLICYRV
jgi:hypothetical protein